MSDVADIGSGRRRRARPLLRTLVGDALRRNRLDQRRTLCDVARDARVSVPYLSEVERGRKEASSEILAAVCDALRIELSDLLAEVWRDLATAEALASSPRGKSESLQPSALTKGDAGRPSALARNGAARGVAPVARFDAPSRPSRHRTVAPPSRRPGDVVLLAA